MLHKHLRDEWYARKRAISPVLMFAPEGLVLGASTVIVAADGPRRLQSLRGRESRALALLSAACGKAVAPSVIGNIERATKAWSDGDDCLAYIHLSYARLQPLQDLRTAAYRLFMARCAMLHGASSRDVFQSLHLDPRYIDAIEKAYNPDEPRVPAGSGRLSGQWTNTDEAGEDGLQGPGDGAAKEEAAGGGTTVLARAPVPTLGASSLGTLDAAQVAELGAYALRVLRIATPIGGAAAVFGILFISSSNDVHIEGEVPEIPGLRYSWNRDETRLRLTYDDPAGARRTFAAYLDGDVFRDKDGQAIGRVLTGGKIAIDIAAAVPDLIKQGEPKLCPEPPVSDRPGSDRGKPYEKNLPRQYEDYLKVLINPDAPTPSGYVYELPNPERNGNPVTYDDCQKKTGILFEFKWKHAGVLGFSQGNKSVIDGFLEQSLRQVEASGGRPVVWIFAEAETAQIARKLFEKAGKGRERIIIVHAEWKRP